MKDRKPVIKPNGLIFTLVRLSSNGIEFYQAIIDEDFLVEHHPI